MDNYERNLGKFHLKMIMVGLIVLAIIILLDLLGIITVT